MLLHVTTCYYMLLTIKSLDKESVKNIRKFERAVIMLSECGSPNNILLVLIWLGGTRWRSWLRHRATSRKVAGSIPDDVIGIFY